MSLVSCPECGVGLEAGRLRRHLRAHRNYQPYACALCACRFYAFDDARLHFALSQIHPPDTQPRVVEELDADIETHVAALLAGLPGQAPQQDPQAPLYPPSATPQRAFVQPPPPPPALQTPLVGFARLSAPQTPQTCQSQPPAQLYQQPRRTFVEPPFHQTPRPRKAPAEPPTSEDALPPLPDKLSAPSGPQTEPFSVEPSDEGVEAPPPPPDASDASLHSAPTPSAALVPSETAVPVQRPAKPSPPPHLVKAFKKEDPKAETAADESMEIVLIRDKSSSQESPAVETPAPAVETPAPAATETPLPGGEKEAEEATGRGGESPSRTGTSWCLLCCKSTGTDWRSHLASAHLGQPTYRCRLCNLTSHRWYLSAAVRQSHARSVHKARPDAFEDLRPSLVNRVDEWRRRCFGSPLPAPKPAAKPMSAPSGPPAKSSRPKKGSSGAAPARRSQTPAAPRQSATEYGPASEPKFQPSRPTHKAASKAPAGKASAAPKAPKASVAVQSSCLGCGAAVGSDVFAQKSHVLKAHLDRPRAECRLCPFRSFDWSLGDLRSHFRSAHGLKGVSAGDADKVTDHYAQLREPLTSEFPRCFAKQLRFIRAKQS